MSPFIAYHATMRRHRESISERGLLAGESLCQPGRFGVYVFTRDSGHSTYSRSRQLWWAEWATGPGQDVWQVAYIGPLYPDHYVANGWILPESVPPQHLSLITPITPRIG